MNYRNYLKLNCCFGLLIFFSPTLFAQNLPTKKEISGVRTIEHIKIDGHLDETIWSLSQTASDFTQFFPHPGSASKTVTEVKVLFDDEALYIGAILYDEMDKVDQDFSQRDLLGISDWFGFSIDSYQDGLNGFEFVVAASGVQRDIMISGSSRTTNWDAVWESKVHFSNEYWAVEMRIPFSALRFSNKEIQEWHVNFIRKTQRDQELSYWNPVDPEAFGVLRQSGLLTINKKLETPINISAMAYTGARFDRSSNQNNIFSQAGSFDIKYGLNNAFTLDVSLVPDVNMTSYNSQRIANTINSRLTYHWQRPMFTEGQYQFSRSNIFSAGRALYYPIYRPELETIIFGSIIERPRSSPYAINAIKLFGRNEKGTGIGFYNAITAPTFVTTEDVIGNIKKNVVDPLTNYNVFVIDQNLPNNSFLSFTNTNVLRQGDHYDANVSGLEFHLNNKGLSWSVVGDGA